MTNRAWVLYSSNVMKPKMLVLSLVALLSTVLAPALAHEQTQGKHEDHPHHHQVVVVEVAQARYYIATCSQNDLYQRFASREAAYQAAQAHARQTGHKTGVIKE